MADSTPITFAFSEAEKVESGTEKTANSQNTETIVKGIQKSITEKGCKIKTMIEEQYIVIYCGKRYIAVSKEDNMLSCGIYFNYKFHQCGGVLTEQFVEFVTDE